MLLTNGTGGLFLQTMLYLANTTHYKEDVDSNSVYQVPKPTADETICYGIYGCFPITYPWRSPARPIALLPESPEKVNPIYRMFSPKNINLPSRIDVNDPFLVHNLKINTDRKVFFVSHGYLESGERPWVYDMAKELIMSTGGTVISIDWSGGSNPPYTQAVANIRIAAAITAHLIEVIHQSSRKPHLDYLHLIGHSLGAHLVGYVGNYLQKNFNLTVGRITGMDPAEPHFANSPAIVRLDRSSAKYVDIIHTDASGFVKAGLGIKERIGHVDFYPNGGLDQPGCNQGVFNYVTEARGSIMKGIGKFFSCSHIRSYQFFTESINVNSDRYLAINCSSYEEFTNGSCFQCDHGNQICLPFGYHSEAAYRKYVESGRILPEIDSTAMYMLTGKSSPYLHSHFKVIVELDNSSKALNHGGEVGVLSVVIHGTVSQTEIIHLTESAKHHDPGLVYSVIVGGKHIGRPVSVSAYWQNQMSMFNPFSWRVGGAPRVFVSKIKVQSLEYRNSIITCPETLEGLHSDRPSVFLPTYCRRRKYY